MGNVLSFGIIGCGNIAARHAANIMKVGSLVAVCDVVEERATAMASQFGSKPYTSIEALLEGEPTIDVVVVCTPNGLHAQHSILALEAGKHVVCEKPMAIIADDCRAMIAAAEKAERKLFVVKQNRFNPPVVAVKEALDKGLLGKVLSIQLSCFWNRDTHYYKGDWKGTQVLDGGILFTQFSHFVDLLYWMVGDVDTVQGLAGNLVHQGVTEFADTVVATARFKNGVLGTLNFTINAHSRNMEGSITLFCDKGTVKIGGQYLNVLEYAAVEGFSFGNIPEGNKANDYGSYTGSMSNHDKVYMNVVDVLLNQGNMNISMYDGLKTVEIIEKIHISCQ